MVVCSKQRLGGRGSAILGRVTTLPGLGSTRGQHDNLQFSATNSIANRITITTALCCCSQSVSQSIPTTTGSSDP